jgi:hypothetical protein
LVCFVAIDAILRRIVQSAHRVRKDAGEAQGTADFTAMFYRDQRMDAVDRIVRSARGVSCVGL